MILFEKLWPIAFDEAPCQQVASWLRCQISHRRNRARCILGQTIMQILARQNDVSRARHSIEQVETLRRIAQLLVLVEQEIPVARVTKFNGQTENVDSIGRWNPLNN